MGLYPSIREEVREEEGEEGLVRGVVVLEVDMGERGKMTHYVNSEHSEPLFMYPFSHYSEL